MTSCQHPHPSSYLPSQPTRATRSRPGIETRQILLTLGAVCLIVAFTAGTALVWASLGPGGQAALMAAVTLALLVGAATMRRLTATADALAAVGLAGCAIDAVAARTLHLSFASELSLRWYVVIAALGVTAVAATLGVAAPRLRSAPVVWSVALLVAAVAATDPVDLSRVAYLAPVGIIVAVLLDHVLRRSPAAVPARAVNAAAGTAVAAVGFVASLSALAQPDPAGLAGAAVPLALFALPALAGSRGLVADAASATVAGVSAAMLVMAALTHAAANQRAVASVVLLVFAAAVRVIDGDPWVRRTQVAVTPLIAPGAVAWLSVAAVDARFAVVDFTLSAVALGVAAAWPSTRKDAASVRASALAAAGGLASLGAGITLHLHGVTTLEAYLATPAGFMLAVGTAILVRDREASSVALVPSLVTMILPTLLASLGHDHQRQMVLLVAATLLVVVGAQLRLGTPLVVGTTVIGLLSLRLAGPHLAALEKWQLFAAVGAVLLTLGATWDARVRDAHRIAGRLRPQIEALR